MPPPRRDALDRRPADRPRERLLRLGPDELPDAELLALVLGTRGPQVAERLLASFPDLRRLGAAGVGELTAVPGIGLAQACRLKGALALAARLWHRPFLRGEEIG